MIRTNANPPSGGPSSWPEKQDVVFHPSTAMGDWKMSGGGRALTAWRPRSSIAQNDRGSVSLLDEDRAPERGIRRCGQRLRSIGGGLERRERIIAGAGRGEAAVNRLDVIAAP